MVEDELDAALPMTMKISAGTALVETATVGNLSEVTRLLTPPDAKGFINSTHEDEEGPTYRQATSVLWAATHDINVKT